MQSSTTAIASPDALPGLDLKRSLMYRVLVVTMACFAAASTIAVVATLWELHQANANAARIIGQSLEIQLFKIDNSMDTRARFPDWELAAEHVLTQGRCARYITQDGTVERTDCVGSGEAFPVWLPAALQPPLAAWTEESHALFWRGRSYGRVVVTTEPATITSAVLKSVAPMLALAALMGSAICLLLYGAIGRALGPTRQVLEGLDRLARGDLSCRLPRFRLRELQRISEVFNAMAANIQASADERQALAANLVDTAELERRRIARDLHDELAQNLAAMSALAASIQATANQDCPSLSEEATRLQETAASVMKSLRATLRDLRPQEIDDLGLGAGLAALIANCERRANGALSITLETSTEIDDLPPATSAHVYRIIQEGLANVVKHADASHAHVGLRLAPAGSIAGSDRRQLELLIEDDGRGMSASGDGTGFGLVGMRERVMALGGTFKVGAAPAMGVSLRVLIPVATCQREMAA